MTTLKPANLDPVSWPRMIRAVEKVRERLTRAVRALEGAGIPYALAGGHAVAAWVSIPEVLRSRLRELLEHPEG
jgi:hypothetical protein